MFEVIPNWHPLFVHFPLALLSVSTLFFIALKFIKHESIHEQLKVMAYWNLWLGTGFAIVTAITGWLAYNSVTHDTPSHEAMTDHKNWALITLSVFIIISILSIKQYRKTQDAGMIFTFIMIMAFVLLASTGWRGSEVVYRYGLGVMSMPKAEDHGHAHPANNNEAVNTQKNEKSNTHSDSLDSTEHHDEHDSQNHTH